VEIGDQWSEEPSTVQREAKMLFEKRFTVTKDLGVRLDAVEFKTLTGEDNLGLIVGFTKKEIRDAVWQCEGVKSPDPDGFNFNFLKKCWEVIKVEVVEAVEQFHENGIIPKGYNASFVALVPKVRDPSRLEQYKPISLVGAIYKIIAKLLAKRIKKVLPSVVDESQSAFLKDRGILDSVLMANEVVEDIRRRGRSGLCLKVDFEKAYDSVRREFLYDILQRMGFHHRGIIWIRGCLESATISILVNGSPTEEFKPSRGLRQGDPLAPFLYLVVAEGLAGLVRQAVKTNMLSSLKIGRKEVDMSLLQYVDDTLFLCENSFSNVVTLKAILRGFEVASGLKINFHKSKLIDFNVLGSDIDCYTWTLNCSQMGNKFNYLGLEVGETQGRKSSGSRCYVSLNHGLICGKGDSCQWLVEYVLSSPSSRPYCCIISLFSKLQSRYVKVLSASREGFSGVGERRKDRWLGLVGKTYVNRRKKGD